MTAGHAVAGRRAGAGDTPQAAAPASSVRQWSVYATTNDATP